MPKAKPYERRAKARGERVWRDPAKELPDADIMVLLLVEQTDDEPYVTAAYDSGSRWRSAHSATPINGRKAGWMHMHEAVALLSRATRGEVVHG